MSQADEAILLGLRGSSGQADKGRDITRPHDGSHGIPLIVKGWSCRYQLLGNGKRQILTLYLPGDLCEPFGTLPGFADYPLGALTFTTYRMVSRQAVFHAAGESAACERALWWDLLVATNIEREHIVSLGRRSAAERLGHLFCELEMRLEMAGLPTHGGYDMPLTQADLGDLLGLTPVHVNRSLQDLRASGLISLENRRLTIRNRAELRAMAEFDPAYLHAEQSRRGAGGW